MNRHCVHGFASGRVQGVGYRAFTQAAASSAGLSGWVRNTADGRVEFVLAGDAAAIDGVLATLRRGPARAAVSALSSQSCDDEGWDGFHILR